MTLDSMGVLCIIMSSEIKPCRVNDRSISVLYGSLRVSTQLNNGSIIVRRRQLLMSPTYPGRMIADTLTTAVFV